jgi:hypothetical protein
MAATRVPSEVHQHQHRRARPQPVPHAAIASGSGMKLLNTPMWRMCVSMVVRL